MLNDVVEPFGVLIAGLTDEISLPFGWRVLFVLLGTLHLSVGGVPHKENQVCSTGWSNLL